MIAGVVVGAVATGGLILAIERLTADADPISDRDRLGTRAAQAVERAAVASMPRDELEESCLELARGTRDQARRIHVLEDALEQHRRECCTREDCCGALEVEAR